VQFYYKKKKTNKKRINFNLTNSDVPNNFEPHFLLKTLFMYFSIEINGVQVKNNTIKNNIERRNFK
jgi:hypothetical protein